jgi:very-short-patch-repair endonuclease
MTPGQFDRLVARISSRQYGIVSRTQALRVGATEGLIRERLRSGRWERMQSGVYRLAGTPPSWHSSVMAACLACGAGAAASHFSAGPLWEIPGLKQGPIELSTARNGTRSKLFTVHRVLLLPKFDVTVRLGIPVTTPTRTLIDLASVAEENLVEEALDDLLRRRLVIHDRVRRRLAALGRRPGVGLIRSLLDAREPGATVPQSVFETKFFKFLKRGGLPEPVLQYHVRFESGRNAFIDFAYPDCMLAIETDGKAPHYGRRNEERDRTRHNALTALGWRVLHITWSDLTERPDETLARIKAALTH